MNDIQAQIDAAELDGYRDSRAVSEALEANAKQQQALQAELTALQQELQKRAQPVQEQLQAAQQAAQQETTAFSDREQQRRGRIDALKALLGD